MIRIRLYLQNKYIKMAKKDMCLQLDVFIIIVRFEKLVTNPDVPSSVTILISTLVFFYFNI